MKLIGIMIVLACALTACARPLRAADEFPPMPDDIIFGAAPDQSVQNWVRLNILGARDHPLPILWISPQKFERRYPDVLLVLPQDDYKTFTTFIRSNKCAADENKIATRGTVQVTEYSDGDSNVLCIMPRARACNYFKKIMAIPTIIWTDEKTAPFFGLMGEVGCE